ncbi:hypothetical protein ACP70R_002037 [Stipagrostis hirtigluma subsp. patula]
MGVNQENSEQVSIFADPSDLRRIPEQHNHNLKSVKIDGFSSARSLVELACHVLERSTSLECLTLESPHSSWSQRCSESHNISCMCCPLPIDVIMEARRAILAVRTYIEPRVPSKVKLSVLGPCNRCHVVDPWT